MDSRNPIVLAIAGSLALAAAAFVILPAAPAAAQEVVQNEGSAYSAWLEAAKAGNNAKALELAKGYLAQYPSGQYVEVIKKWMKPVESAVQFQTAVKEKRTGDIVKFGRELLVQDPDNLGVLLELAYNLRNNELFASPPSYEHAADAVEFAKKAIALVEAGKAPANVQKFDKNASLSWLTQVLAVVEAKNGTPEEAVKLYEKSTALGPGNVPVVGRNLIAVFGIRQNGYAEAAKVFNALPEADKTAADMKPEAKAALDKVNQQADALIESGAAFVAFAKVKNLAPSTREKVYETLQAVYKSRHPEDATLAGLQKMLQDKEATLGAAAAPGA